MTESYKHSSLLRYKINYGGKKFWGRGPVSDTKKQRKKTFRQTYLFPGPGISQNVLRSFLTRVSIGKVFMVKFQRQQHVPVTTVLTLASLGNATQIEMILSVLRRPRLPRQVKSLLLSLMFSSTNFANVHILSLLVARREPYLLGIC